ncbi:rna recognition motif-containing protein, partial [Nannochloropsis gaditana CCMP526]|uniref:rna recognition motif-containing protein n=1 Tax=Nannochloropsis gaditana (strain CCMP526) TaxID=1093141 RepID=UPI00029F5850
PPPRPPFPPCPFPPSLSPPTFPGAPRVQFRSTPPTPTPSSPEISPASTSCPGCSPSAACSLRRSGPPALSHAPRNPSTPPPLFSLLPDSDTARTHTPSFALTDDLSSDARPGPLHIFRRPAAAPLLSPLDATRPQRPRCPPPPPLGAPGQRKLYHYYLWEALLPHPRDPPLHLAVPCQASVVPRRGLTAPLPLP